VTNVENEGNNDKRHPGEAQEPHLRDEKRKEKGPSKEVTKKTEEVGKGSSFDMTGHSVTFSGDLAPMPLKD
jgi:hypothetical protein